MPQACCPTCNRPLPKPKIAQVDRSFLATNTAELSDVDLFKYYAITGPLGDCEHLLKSPHVQGQLRADLKILRTEMEAITIAGKRPGKPLIDRYVSLVQVWRHDAMERWRLERLQAAADAQAELDAQTTDTENTEAA